MMLRPFKKAAVMKVNPSTKTSKNQKSQWLARTGFIVLLCSIATATDAEAQKQNVLARFTNPNGGIV